MKALLAFLFLASNVHAITIGAGGNNASDLTLGTLPNERVDKTSVTAQGNTFGGANQLPILDGSGLIQNVDLDLASATKQGNTFNGANQILRLDGNSSLVVAGSSFTTQTSSAALFCFRDDICRTTWPSGGGDNLGNHVSSKSLDMGNFAIYRTSIVSSVLFGFSAANDTSDVRMRTALQNSGSATVGTLFIDGGAIQGTATGGAGPIQINGGDIENGSGAAGAVSVNGGDSQTSSSGADSTVRGGNSTSGTGGNANVNGGTGASDAQGGSVIFNTAGTAKFRIYPTIGLVASASLNMNGNAVFGSSNVTTTDLTVTSATIGGGAPIMRVQVTSATLNFESIPAQSSLTYEIAVTSATKGDALFLGVDDDVYTNGSITTNTVFSVWVGSTTNRVNVRGTNNDASSASNPAFGSFVLKLLQTGR